MGARRVVNKLSNKILLPGHAVNKLKEETKCIIPKLVIVNFRRLNINHYYQIVKLFGYCLSSIFGQ